MKISNSKMQRAALELAGGNSKAGTARKAGISPTTLYSYLKKPEFYELVEKMKGEVYKRDIEKSMADIDPSMEFLRQVRDDEEEPTRNRMAATKILLNKGIRMAENREVIQKLEKLERQVSDLERLRQ